MSFGKYLRDRWKTMALLAFAVISSQIFLLVYPIHMLIRLYVALTEAGAFLLGTYLEYYAKKAYYEELLANLQHLKEKYMIVEMLQEPCGVEEELLQDILRESNKSMLEHVNAYKLSQKEYKEYIELWIHEVKLPIATSKMIIENNRSDVTNRIEEEINEIEEYTEQALFYARSNNANRDYFVTACKLSELVKDTVRQNRKKLIRQRMRILIDDMEHIVYTDAKWVQFILGQIIDNSVKYKNAQNAVLHFFSEEKKDCVILMIQDNGIGIRGEELGRVFEKGFTGSNGRIGKKSTGIGLYLCKKLCDKLGLGIRIYSEEGEGTRIKIIFPKNSMSNLTKL